MILDRVTITGADDSVTPADILAISYAFPFVEWGILVSASNVQHQSHRTRTPRFPSWHWLSELQRMAGNMSAMRPGQPRLSLHVCGRWVRDLLLGDMTIPVGYLGGFQRIQFNFHAEKTPCKLLLFCAALRELRPQEFIFQIDGAKGNAHLAAVAIADMPESTLSLTPLFDISGGAGILPTEWPRPYMLRDGQPVYHGYAGGLSPDNLAEQLPKIAEAAGDARIWIDVETHVRSADDRQFDLDKVRRFLEIAAPHVTATSVPA